jgi:hypothetical protein
MRRIRLATIAVACLLGVVVGATSQSPQTGGTGVVAGQVVNATTGQPLGGAVVTLALSGAGPDSVIPGNAPMAPAAQRRGVAVTNGEGRFVFRDLPAGSFVITTTLDGYAPGMSGRKRPGGPGQSFTIGAGARTTDARIDMWKLASISGYVRDEHGEPVIGLAMNTLRVVMNGGRPELTFSGGEATDDRGYYRAFNLMPGAYVVGFRSSWNTVSIATADEHRAAVAAGGAGAAAAARMQQPISTGVLNIQGKQLNFGEWAVHFNEWEPPALPGPNDTVLRYPNMFHPNALSTSEAAVIALRPGEDRTGIDFALQYVPSVRVSGVLMGPEGPAAGHGIRLYPADGTVPAFPVPVAYGQTDAAGRFALLGVTPGSYVVEAYRVRSGTMFRVPPPPPPPPPELLRAAGKPVPEPVDTSALFASAPVTVGTSHVDNVSLMLKPGTPITGRVLFDGAAAKPAAAALQKTTVTIRPLSGTLPGSTDARVDAEGRFAFSGFPPGRYVLFAATAPGPEWAIASFQIAGVDAAGQAFELGDTGASAVLTFTDKFMTLSGTVAAGAAKSDVAGSTVVIFPADTEEWIKTGMSPRRTASTPSSASGAFSVRVPLPGDYVAVAVPPEIAPDIDREFIKRVLPSAVRISLLPGESKTVSLTLARVK